MRTANGSIVMSLPSKTSRLKGSPLADILKGDSPAYQKKGALCDQPPTRRLRRGRHLLELDDVALGIANVNRKPRPMRPITHRRLPNNLDRQFAKVAHDLVQVASLDPDAYVIDIDSRLDPWASGRDQIDHAAARTQLDQPDLRNPPLLAKAQDARVEVVGAILIAASQHDVIEFGDLEWNFHNDTLDIPTTFVPLPTMGRGQALGR